MSKTAIRYRYFDAKLIAEFALEAIAPFTERGTIAGSIRRGRDQVGDIDLVVELLDGNPWAKAQLGSAVMAGLNYDIVKDGDQIMHLEPRGLAHRPAIDVYIATPITWGITLLVRTGSAAHNFKLAQLAGRRLPARKFALHGIEDSAGRVIASKTEHEIFDALGLPYVEPPQRESPEHEQYVSQATA